MHHLSAPALKECPSISHKTCSPTGDFVDISTLAILTFDLRLKRLLLTQILIEMWLQLQLKHDNCYDTFCASIVKMASLSADADSVGHFLWALHHQFGCDNMLETFVDLFSWGVKKGKEQLAIAR